MRKFNKKLASLLLGAVTAVAMLVMPAMAADSSVTYAGGAEKFVFLPGSQDSETDLFDNFKNVMPGDTLTQKITVTNPKNNKFRAKIYLRSLGGIEEEEFLKQMSLKVTEAEDTKLFEAPSNETGDLTEYTLLGTLSPGAEVTLQVELTVPIEMGNEFQEKAGKIQWEFAVEELPLKDDDNESGGGGGGRKPTNPTEAISDPPVPAGAGEEFPTISIGDLDIPLAVIPKLGDMGIGAYVIGLVLLLAVAGGALYMRKRFSSKEQ